jgi:hypothetical protein
MPWPVIDQVIHFRLAFDAWTYRHRDRLAFWLSFLAISVVVGGVTFLPVAMGAGAPGNHDWLLIGWLGFCALVGLIGAFIMVWVGQVEDYCYRHFHGPRTLVTEERVAELIHKD